MFDLEVPPTTPERVLRDFLEGHVADLIEERDDLRTRGRELLEQADDVDRRIRTFEQLVDADDSVLEQLLQKLEAARRA